MVITVCLRYKEKSFFCHRQWNNKTINGLVDRQKVSHQQFWLSFIKQKWNMICHFSLLYNCKKKWYLCVLDCLMGIKAIWNLGLWELLISKQRNNKSAVNRVINDFKKSVCWLLAVAALELIISPPFNFQSNTMWLYTLYTLFGVHIGVQVKCLQNNVPEGQSVPVSEGQLSKKTWGIKHTKKNQIWSTTTVGSWIFGSLSRWTYK